MKENSKFAEKFERLKKFYRKVMLFFNLVVLAFYTTLTIINISKDYGSLYTKLLVVCLVLHVSISLLISFLKYFDNKTYLSQLKNSVIIVDMLKNVLTLINLLMGVIALFASLLIGETSSTYSLVVMISSIALTLLQILFSLLRIWFKKYMARTVDTLKIKAGDFKNSIKSKFSSLRHKDSDVEQEQIQNTDNKQ